MQRPLHAIAAFATLFLLCLDGRAQSLVARAGNVTGQVQLTSRNAPPFALPTGYQLNPGDRIETRADGRVAIDLSDGSMIVVQSNSIIFLKDFTNANSMRELFEITLGTVRVTINHLGGKPNPYRMNSPTASVAVRGTDFSITVDSRGEMQVAVYEGSVEVTSLTDPKLKVVVEAGRAVLVNPAGQDFRMLNYLPGREVAQRGDASGRDRHASSSTRADPHQDPQNDNDQRSPRAAAGTYERYIASLSQIGQVPFLLRFNAFADSHLDSLENPAYAVTFQHLEGRISFLPSFRGVEGVEENATTAGLGGTRSADYSLSPQLSLFAPLGGANFVVGGSFTESHIGSGLQSLSSESGQNTPVIPSSNSSVRTSGSSATDFLSASVLGAWRFRKDSSVGFALEELKGVGSLSGKVQGPISSASSVLEQTASVSNLHETRLTLGFHQTISPALNFGFFYRYGFIEANDGDRSHLLNSVPVPLDATYSTGHSSEFGFRLRGTWTPRVFYGVVASTVGISLTDKLTRAALVPSNQRDRSQRASTGLGLGLLPNSRTVISFDLSGGASNGRTTRAEDLTSSLLQTGRDEAHFVSGHVAFQVDLSRKVFVSGSLLSVWQSHEIARALFPDSLGQTVPLQDSFLPLDPVAYRPGSQFSDFGAGWRFSPALFAQYVYSTDYGVTAGSHTLILRYTFHSHRD